MSTWTWAGSLQIGAGGGIISGTGTPQGVVTAPVGTLFLRVDGSTGSTLYVKESGSGNIGWSIAGSGGGGGGSGNIAAQRQTVDSLLASGTGQYVEVDFSVPYADDLYTVTATIETAEGILTAPVTIGSILKNSPGIGVFAYVYNFDSAAHNITIHIMAVHD